MYVYLLLLFAKLLCIYFVLHLYYSGKLHCTIVFVRVHSVVVMFILLLAYVCLLVYYGLMLLHQPVVVVHEQRSSIQ
jgi:hypothetical protein